MKIPPCGAYCESCVVYKKRCAGCIETNGKPFYLKDSKKDICPVYQCVTEHEVEHCGMCKEFPCDTFLNWYDPERGIVTALRRAGLLALRKKLGPEAWLRWIRDKKIEFGT